MNAPIEYEQTDPRWADIMYSSVGNRFQTIGREGCGPTCAAMVVATLRDKSITPVQAADWSVNHGYLSDNDGTYWAYFAAYLRKYGIGCEQVGPESFYRVREMLRKDRMVITSMRKGHWTSGGHFILAYGLSDDESYVKIHDPNSEAWSREHGNITHYRNEAVQYWIVPEVWKLEIKSLKIKDLDRNKELSVMAVNVDGYNYIRLRDAEKLAPITVGNEGAVPTVRANYK